MNTLRGPAFFSFDATLVDGGEGDQTGDAEESTSTTAAPVPKTAESAPPPSDNQAPTKIPAKAPNFFFNFGNTTSGNPTDNDATRKLAGSSKKEQRRLRNRHGQARGPLALLRRSADLRVRQPVPAERAAPCLRRRGHRPVTPLQTTSAGTRRRGGEPAGRRHVGEQGRGRRQGGRDIRVGFVDAVEVIGLIPPAVFLLNRGSINQKG
ncbi:hypothetical protein THAOC_14267 [Thalassiosira oceanica]|uniref:Uncharacterized protein n=1 Tax=Thalassiosira oceanica TaxID=159749 RepID=K0SFL6_THAOC|nr:hypothetical protein THAOC_14267 [Thalassiosira oceanica]|eukprot:EJK64943.1 hypothetical protein THAOC_14267 [Thalassiosira oceanica]